MSEDETVALGVYSPDILDPKTGRLTPEGLQIDKLRQTPAHDDCGNSSGISVARMKFDAATGELKAVVQELVEKPRKDGVARVSIGYAPMSVSELTASGITTLDDGWEEFVTHAVLRSTKSRGELRGIRESLLSKLNASLVRWEQPQKGDGPE